MTVTEGELIVTTGELEEFLAGVTERDPRASVAASALYIRWQDWCEAHGRPVPSITASGRLFRARFAKDPGVEYARTNSGTVYRGLKLAPIEEG